MKHFAIRASARAVPAAGGAGVERVHSLLAQGSFAGLRPAAGAAAGRATASSSAHVRAPSVERIIGGMPPSSRVTARAAGRATQPSAARRASDPRTHVRVPCDVRHSRVMVTPMDDYDLFHDDEPEQRRQRQIMGTALQGHLDEEIVAAYYGMREDAWGDSWKKGPRWIRRRFAGDHPADNTGTYNVARPHPDAGHGLQRQAAGAAARDPSQDRRLADRGGADRDERMTFTAHYNQATRCPRTASSGRRSRWDGEERPLILDFPPSPTRTRSSRRSGGPRRRRGAAREVGGSPPCDRA